MRCLLFARIDPDRVVIAVRDALHLAPRLAAVDGLEERRAALVRDLGVGRVDADLAVVHRAIVVVATGTSTSCRRRPSARCRSSFGSGGGGGCAASAAAATAAAAPCPGCDQRAVVVDAGAGAAARADFDRRVDRGRLRPRDVEADAADDRVVGQAVARELRPGLAARRSSSRCRCPGRRR